MESRTFIRQAAEIMSKMEGASLPGPNQADRRDAVQKELKTTFAGLQNPTLPSASKLLAAAQARGYVVDQNIATRIQNAEAAWS